MIMFSFRLITGSSEELYILWRRRLKCSGSWSISLCFLSLSISLNLAVTLAPYLHLSFAFSLALTIPEILIWHTHAHFSHIPKDNYSRHNCNKGSKEQEKNVLSLPHTIHRKHLLLQNNLKFLKNGVRYFLIGRTVPLDIGIYRELPYRSGTGPYLSLLVLFRFILTSILLMADGCLM